MRTEWRQIVLLHHLDADGIKRPEFEWAIIRNKLRTQTAFVAIKRRYGKCAANNTEHGEGKKEGQCR